MNMPPNDPREELPIPGYDQLTPGELEHRIRSLGPGELEKLLAYERAHADRPAVVRLLSHRLADLQAGATPTPGGEGRPGHADATRTGSPVQPGTSPQPFSAPPHGNPRQWGKPKGDDRIP
ncbi:hypothetical protein [Streptomyces aidingensis]|uniref:DUF8129 domain-containing protein n=1 Tax=Streptomyces aidingensis TaxID=910347 RepID=A0A1I1R0Z6_9ACTN|nr:hypothetical protein SAMN05421773_112123 [Streptomyces aidingensis]